MPLICFLSPRNPDSDSDTIHPVQCHQLIHQTLTECLLCGRGCGGEQHPQTIKYVVWEGKRGIGVLGRVVREGSLIGCHMSRDLKVRARPNSCLERSISGTRQDV